jgi:hypothetical protein
MGPRSTNPSRPAIQEAPVGDHGLPFISRRTSARNGEVNVRGPLQNAMRLWRADGTVRGKRQPLPAVAEANLNLTVRLKGQAIE